MDEQKKYEAINGLADHPDSNKERAALTLGCTVRHINRMLAGYRASGKAYFVHGNNGRMPANTIPAATKAAIVDLYRNKYYDDNFSHFDNSTTYRFIKTAPVQTGANVSLILGHFQKYLTMFF